MMAAAIWNHVKDHDCTMRLLAGLWLAFVLLLVSAVVITGVLWLTRTEPLLAPYSEASITNLGTVMDDGYVEVELNRCALDAEPVSIISLATYQSVKEASVKTSAGVTPEYVWSGCITTSTRYPLNTRIMVAGEWRISGVDIVVGSRVRQSVYWESDVFEIR